MKNNLNELKIDHRFDRVDGYEHEMEILGAGTAGIPGLAAADRQLRGKWVNIRCKGYQGNNPVSYDRRNFHEILMYSRKKQRNWVFWESL